MSVIDSFLNEIKKCVAQSNGSRLVEFMVLNLDGLSPDKQGPYNGLLQELNSQFSAGKEAALSQRVTQALMRDGDDVDLQRFLTRFSRCVVDYFHYVRDYPTDSNLQKARKIESLTKKCIEALDKSTPTIIPLVLSFTGTLRSIAINLDRDPSLLGTTASAADDDVANISFMENTGNILREAFNKAIKYSKSTDRPSPNDITSGIYLIVNSSMQIYAQAGKLRNAEFMLIAIDRNGPSLEYYPASQRVMYLYYLGRYHFANNHFHRAAIVLNSAYKQCHTHAIQQRRRILTHLIAANMILGRLPGQILIRDQAAHAISKPFLQLSQIIRSGDIGRFHTFLDYTDPSSHAALWFLKRSILLQLRSRCEVLVWRSLIYQTMRLVGNLGDESGSAGGKQMPWVRFTHIHQAAEFSVNRARDAVYNASNGTINHYEDDYVDPDFADPDGYDEDHDDAGNNGDGVGVGGNAQAHSTTINQSPFNQSPFATNPSSQQHSHTNGTQNTHANDSSDHNHNHIDLISLYPPTPSEINSAILSLISQGLLKGFVQHNQADMLQSRFAIPGVRKPGGGGSSSSQLNANPFNLSNSSNNGNNSAGAGAVPAWKEVGFPKVWDVLWARYMEWEGNTGGEEENGMDGDMDVPGWITRGKVRRREQRNEMGGGGRVIHLSGVRAAGS